MSSWNGTPGTGTTSVVAAAAHAGTNGLRMTNTAGQFSFAVKALPGPLVDSSTSFWVRVGTAAGFENIAQARDGTSSLKMWELYYDGAQKRFVLFAFRNTVSAEIDTNPNSAPAGTWVKVEVQYAATATGGAQVYVNDQTKPAWGVRGDYTRSANLARIQLWNDVVNTTDFDDVQVAIPAGAATLPGAPTGVTGAAGNGSVALSWTAPASNGGSPITGYRVTPSIGGTAQTPVTTGSAATSYTVTGLTNGTAYTFTVAAINAAGTGPDSAASSAVTPLAAATAPGAPTGLVGTAGDANVALSWTAPSNGGSAITGYVVTPYVGGLQQGPGQLTGSSATNYTFGGLTNGTAYTFSVAAINAIGTGPNSAASAPVTPLQALSQYTNVVFADGFESGTLGGWNGSQGTGSTAVVAAAARTGAYGLRIVSLETSTSTSSRRYPPRSATAS